MRNIVVFAILALVLAGLVPKFAAGIKPENAVPPASGRLDAGGSLSAPSAGPRSVTIRPDAFGQFHVEGQVDGRRIEFIVDTGASYVSIPEQEAERLGYHPSQREYTLRMQTANGVGRAAPVRLDMVEVGGIMVRNVDAVVMPDGASRLSLLGMSFLSRLHRFESRDGRLVLEE